MDGVIALTSVYIRDRLSSMNELPLRIQCCDVRAVDDRDDGLVLETTALFKALGDPTRYEIYRLIAAQSDEICVCNITDKFDVSQPTISHHLKVLREAGLITVARRGVWAWYAADQSGAERLRAAVNEMVPIGLAMTR